MKRIGIAVGAIALAATVHYAASVPPLTVWDPTNALGVINGWLQQSLNPSVTPGSMASYITGRNLLDNGDMWVNQRAATATCGTTTTSGLTAAAYSADRWTCDVNITTGAGQLAVVTSSPSPPVGFINSQTLVRNSGALLANQCAMQEIPTYKATAMAGQNVILSAYVEALAGLNADNGNLVNMYLVTGTGTSEGFGLRGAVGMAASVKQSSFTISTSTGLITNSTAVVAGEPVTITASVLPTGIVSSQVYYVSSALLNSGTAFAIAPTYAAAIAGTNTVIPSTAGTSNVMNFTPPYPAWTGVAVYGTNNSGQGQTSVKQAWGQVESNFYTVSSSAWTRLATTPISVPTTTTEAGVLICFQPLGTTSGGSTDGIGFTGVQLEIAGPNQVTPSPYEFKNPRLETQDAEAFYWQINDTTAHTLLSTAGLATTTAACELWFAFPVPFDAVPTLTINGTPGTGVFKILNLAQGESTFTTLAAPGTSATLPSLYQGPVLASVITGSPLTAGQTCALVGQTAGTTASISWSADY